MDKKTPLLVAGIVFALVAIAHLWRISTGASILVNGSELPLSASWIGLIVTGLLSLWMFASTCCCGPKSCGINNGNNNNKNNNNNKDLHK